MVVRVLWESNYPLKITLTFWLAINNKLLTWENLRKRGFQGIGFCSLCKLGEELTSHLFGSCTYAGQVWNNAAQDITQARMDNTKGDWEQRAKDWWANEALFNYASFLVLFVYTMWETRNRVIFKNPSTPIDISTNMLV